jgi:hypothetical protein
VYVQVCGANWCVHMCVVLMLIFSGVYVHMCVELMCVSAVLGADVYGSYV